MTANEPKPKPVNCVAVTPQEFAALMARYGLTEVKFTKHELSAAGKLVREGAGIRKT